MTDATPPTPPADGTPPPPPPAAAAATPPPAAPTTPPPAAPTTPPPAAPTTPPPAAPTTPPAAVAPAVPKPVKPGSATTLIWRRPDRATLVGALTAVIVAWVIELVLQVVYLIQDFSYSIDDGFEYLPRSIGDFGFYGIWQALFFFGPAFLVLWMLLPIVKESPLPVVLKRAAAAGVAGLAGLIFFGLVDGIFDSINQGAFYIGYFGVDLLWGPLSGAITFTVYLAVGATIAWLRAHRPAKAAPVAPVAPVAPAPVAPPTA